jgi:hypothetical protein
MTPIDLNRRLATLLGWADIIELGGALLGTPPAGEAQSRGQALVPNWAGDWRHCGPLSTEHQVDTLHNWTSVIAKWAVDGWRKTAVTDLEDGSDTRDDAARLAIVSAVISKLEASQ